MQIHVHLGYDSRIGKTLSLLLNFALLYPNKRVLILDMDNYGFKVHQLLSPLDTVAIDTKSSMNNKPYGLYHIGGTDTFVASWPNSVSPKPNLFFETLTQSISDISVAVKDYIEQDNNLRFEGFQHILVDTSASILEFDQLENRLKLPPQTSRLKLWINHDGMQYTAPSTPQRFWEAYRRIRDFNDSRHIIVGSDDNNLSFIYVFNPAGFMSDRERKSTQFSLMGFFGNVPYKRLVDYPANENVWLSPDSIVMKPNHPQSMLSFDRELARVLKDHSDTRGAEIERWWADQPCKKPLNVAFIPVEADLKDYRDTWATSKPLTGLKDFRRRLGSVLVSESLRDQWLSLVNMM